METQYGKLPPEFKSKWVAALRSGEYKQATATLFDQKENGYCCLGVACNIVGIENSALVGYVSIQGGCDPNFKVPRILTGPLQSDTARGILAEMNDGRNGHKKHSFSEIADWIDKHL